LARRYKNNKEPVDKKAAGILTAHVFAPIRDVLSQLIHATMGGLL